MLRTALCSFTAGGATAGVAGYYMLHQDVYRAHSVLEQSMQQVAGAVREENARLSKRLDALEQLAFAPAVAEDTGLSKFVPRQESQGADGSHTQQE